jgi:NADH-quinone oxidoreductase subunit L
VLFLLLGATGKSAQIPLFVWLPDAMAGPTPVSALMHAATMVTAGVYLLVRSSVLLEHAPEAKFVIAIIGAATALVGGFTALGQWDIKRVLAYSTVSQLGFMVAAVGIGAYVAAIFHLATHAVFKALLFLGSGSVIHGVEHGHHHVHEHSHDGHDEHHEEEHFDPQDMRNMGGLAGKMPITFITYLIGTFALMGLPFFAGFWSKDEISVLGGQLVFGLLIVSAGFTAFYMWRQIQMVFFGQSRSEAADHAPESVAWMTVPLIILAIGSVFVGLVNIPGGAVPFTWFLPLHSFGHFLESSIPSITEHAPLDFNWALAITATAIAFGAIFLSHSIYAGNKSVVERDDHHLGVDPLYKNAATRQAWSFANARVKWDDFYHAVFLRPYERIGKFLADVVDWRFLHDYFHDVVIKKGFDGIAGLLSNPVDLGLIDGTVNGVGKVVKFFSGRARGIQTGYVRTYAVALLFGVVAVIVLMLAPLLFNGS